MADLEAPGRRRGRRKAHAEQEQRRQRLRLLAERWVRRLRQQQRSIRARAWELWPVPGGLAA
jgi:hypothetical protein